MACVARLLICFVVAGLTAAAASLSTGEPPTAAGSPVLPIDFIENKGQWEHGTRFVARGNSVSARFERDAIVLREPEGSAAEVALVFEGANATARIAGETRRPGRYNFYSGSDPAAWQSNVPAWASVLYRGLYDGVDLRVREQAGRLEYDLILAPGDRCEPCGCPGPGRVLARRGARRFARSLYVHRHPAADAAGDVGSAARRLAPERGKPLPQDRRSALRIRRHPARRRAAARDRSRPSVVHVSRRLRPGSRSAASGRHATARATCSSPRGRTRRTSCRPTDRFPATTTAPALSA